MTRQQRRKLERQNKNRNRTNNPNGLKFNPKLLTKSEVEFCKGIIVDGGSVIRHKTEKIDGLMAIELFMPTPKSKEMWSIIYNTIPSQLTPTTNSFQQNHSIYL